MRLLRKAPHAVGWICVGWLACFLCGVAASKGISRVRITVDDHYDVLDIEDQRRHN